MQRRDSFALRSVNSPDYRYMFDPSPSILARSVSSRLTRPDRERDDKSKSNAIRNVRYKEKYQSMRHKYDEVVLAQDRIKRDLETAHNRIKKLQAENDLLLDAMDIADPGLIERYFPPESPTRNTARELPPSTGPVPEHLSPDMNGGNSTPMTRSSRLSHTNGSSNNTNVQSNGVRHRLNESDNGDVIMSVEANGRKS